MKFAVTCEKFVNKFFPNLECIVKEGTGVIMHSFRTNGWNDFSVYFLTSHMVLHIIATIAAI